MRTVYFIVLDVFPRKPDTLSGCAAILSPAVQRWIEDEYNRRWHVPFAWVTEREEQTPINGHSVRYRSLAAEEDELTSYEWRHLDEKDSDLRWETVCEIGRHGDSLQFALEIRIEAERTMVKPLEYTITRPRVIEDVLGLATCMIEGGMVPSKVQILADEAIPEFVERSLLNKARKLPLVVVSRHEYDELTVDPDALQRELLGLAQVAFLRDRPTFALAAGVGRDLACFGGAVRVYYPGFRKDSPRDDHPIHFTDSIRHYADKGFPLGKRLFRHLVSLSTARLPEAGTIRAAKRSLEKRKQTRITDMLSRLKDNIDGMGEISSALEEAWDEITCLKARNYRLHGQLSAVPLALDPAKPELAADAKQTVSAVVAQARTAYPGTLSFLDSAIDSAADSPYQHPERVEKLCAVLDEIVRRWRTDDALGESWKDALKNAGYDYKENISQTSRGRFGDEYTFQYEGQKYIFGNHVTIGAKQAEKCISVHWLRDDRRKLVLIGHCGRHGTNTSS